ncbi:hypothetical protein Gpo141_00003669 [Globisporangium polare]
MISSGLKKHALVVLIAVLVATYQMFRLESQRTRRGVEVEQEFERATRFLQSQLSDHNGGVGKYEVRVTQSVHGKHKSALVINRQHAVPRIEAELFVDPHLVTKRRQHKSPSKPRSASRKSASEAAKDVSDHKPSLRLRVYDHETMDAVAKALQQKKMVEPNEPSYYNKHTHTNS